ncbi:MAG: glycosyltransferase [Microthrixaceae bacterium]
MRVAIVHDFLTQRGGAERVVLSLMRLYPDADLYTSMYDPEGTFPEFRQYEVLASRLQSLMRPGRDARRILPLYPRIFKKLKLRGYDLVISSTSGFAHGIKVVDGVHVSYCHNPPRWLYQTDDYLAAGSPAPSWARPLLGPLFSVMRRSDKRAARRPDHYIANGNAVAGRIMATYGRTASAVVSPPVDVSRVVLGDRVGGAEKPYALVVSRLLPYKRVDLVVKACQRLGLRLVVVGEGPCYEELTSIAGGVVDFRGRVDDSELNGLLHGCVALVQAGTEDFGIAPLEANAAGRPVVAYAAGGALETVSDGKTGVLVHEQTAEAFAAALTQVRETVWDEDIIRAHADSFGERWFHHELAGAVADCLAQIPVPERAPQLAPVSVPAAALPVLPAKI